MTIPDRPLPVRRTFVVQLGADADPGQGSFAGRVEHVTSGGATHFRDLDELIAFITRTLETTS